MYPHQHPLALGFYCRADPRHDTPLCQLVTPLNMIFLISCAHHVMTTLGAANRTQRGALPPLLCPPSPPSLQRGIKKSHSGRAAVDDTPHRVRLQSAADLLPLSCARDVAP